MRAAMMLLLSGCIAYDETIHVKLHDPAAVTVSVRTPTGETRLLADDAQGEVPATNPPYYEDSRPGASVARSAGTLTAMCPWCEWGRERTLVAADGAVAMPGSPDRVERHAGDVRMHYHYIGPLKCHRTRGLCDRDAFELLLDTPHDNVESIRFEKRVATAHGELIGAKIGLVSGIVFAAVGLGMIGYFDVAGKAGNHDAKLAVLGVGTSFVLVGGMFTWIGAATLRANDSDVPVAIP